MNFSNFSFYLKILVFISKTFFSLTFSGQPNKAAVHDPPEEQVEVANQKISTWLWELGNGLEHQ